MSRKRSKVPNNSRFSPIADRAFVQAHDALPEHPVSPLPSPWMPRAGGIGGAGAGKPIRGRFGGCFVDSYSMDTVLCKKSGNPPTFDHQKRLPMVEMAAPVQKTWSGDGGP